jgi:hypothetical protein
MSLLLWAALTCADAQVHVESLASRELPDGVSFNLGLRGNVTTGNVQTMSLSGATAVHYQTSYEGAEDEPRWTKDHFVFAAHGAYQTAFGNPVLNARFGNVRYARWLHRRVGIGVGLQVNNDAFTLIEWRFTGGLLGQVVLANTARFVARLGTGYSLEHEIRNVPADGPDAVRTLNHRWSSYLAGRAHLVPQRLMLLHTTYVSPRFDDFTDVLVAHESTLQAVVTPVFSLETGVVLRYDTQPPEGVQRLDLAWTTGFSVRWSPAFKKKDPAG